jgi:beta-barrel assembly-enhancing protease
MLGNSILMESGMLTIPDRFCKRIKRLSMNFRALRRRFPLLFILVFSILLSCDQVTKWVAPFILSDEQEVELGNQFKKEIIADTKTYPPFTGDERVSRFVDSLGRRLADLQKDRDTLEFTFTIIEDTSINAFAIPGGHVFVYTGLLKAVDNLAEITGVIAHEIGHITMYHGRDLLMQQSAFSFVETILFGDSASIGGAVTSLLGNMMFLQFSQKNEFQADSCSVAYSTKAGVNPVGMKTFLEELRSRYGEESEIFEPFSTHPPLSDRIDKVEKVIDKTSGASMGSGEKLYSDEYAVIRALLE